MNQEKIGKFIAKIRKEKNMTQQELADKLNVTDRAIGNWENGRRMPDIVFFKPLCQILDISLNELLSGERIKEAELKIKTDEVLNNTIEYSNKRFKKFKNKIILVILITSFLIFIFNFLIDYNRIKKNLNPLFMVQISENKNNYTYIGLGYKMKKVVSTSPNEPLNMSQNIKFGFWILSWDIKVFNTKPYNLWVINNENRILTAIGSYCITDTLDKYKSSECGLAIPIEDIEYKNILPAKSNDTIVIDRNDITITRVTLYDINGNKNNSLIEHSKDNFIIPNVKGQFLVLIDTISDRGTAWYSFKINID